jgi:hypothetical protein
MAACSFPRRSRRALIEAGPCRFRNWRSQRFPPSPPTSPAHSLSPTRIYIRGFLAEAGFAEITVERARPTIIGGSPEEEAQQALMMGPTARLIEEKKPAELTRQTIAREIEAAFAAEASSGPIRLPATIFVVAARRPVSMQ